MRKLTEYPTLSLKERDRRWVNVRAEMAKRGLDCLVLCGWPAMWDFNIANAHLQYFTNEHLQTARAPWGHP